MKRKVKADVMLLDAPWMPGQLGKRGAIRHYDLMEFEQIKDLPIADLTADNAHLWMWVTNAVVPDIKELLEAWGFTYRSMLTWAKPRLGLGMYLRNSTEHLVLATKGRAPVKYHSQPTWGMYPVQDHSHKPEEIYSVIDRVSGTEGVRLELFARRRQPGWLVWGNEIESDIEISGYPVPKYSSAVSSRNKE